MLKYIVFRLTLCISFTNEEKKTGISEVHFYMFPLKPLVVYTRIEDTQEMECVNYLTLTPVFGRSRTCHCGWEV